MKLLKSCCPTFPLDSYLLRNFLPAALSIASAVIVNIVHVEKKKKKSNKAMPEKEDDN